MSDAVRYEIRLEVEIHEDDCNGELLTPGGLMNELERALDNGHFAWCYGADVREGRGSASEGAETTEQPAPPTGRD